MSIASEHLVIPPHISYILLGQGLKIIAFSESVYAFAETPRAIAIDEPVCQSFPELVGSEDILEAIRQGQQDRYEIREVSRQERYFNLYANPLDGFVIILFEDVTEMMTLKQSLVQRANEAEMLLSALRNSKDYLDKVVLSMGDALVITNNRGEIKSLNRAALEMFGYDRPEELKGQRFARFFSGHLWQSELSPEAIACHADHIKNVEAQCKPKTGESLTIEFNCSKVMTDFDQLDPQEFFVYIGRNITARKLAEQKQQAAIAKERELVELKARFLSTATHEFRNPIGSILMCTEMLQHHGENLSDAERQMYIEFIRQSGQNLKDVMEDVLLYSKAEAGKIKLQPVPLSLPRFCDDLIKHLHLSTGQERIQTHYAPGIDQAAMDGKLLNHILQNLLSNALKYSPADQPVHFSIQPNPTKPDHLDFIIQDYGIGIPAADLAHLHESFHRAANVGEIPGTGLGMAIAHKAIHLHQGNLHIDSTLNQGTTMTVTLPRSS